MTKAGQIINMWPGAMAACALPMLLGLGVTLNVLSSGHRADWIFILPISLCFLFGTPLAAWLACRYLRRSKDPANIFRWGPSLGAGVLGASAVHFSAALFYMVGFIFLVSDKGSHSVRADEVFTVFLASVVLNLGLWVIVTLPFSLLCASIFYHVTKIQKAGSDV